MINFRDVFAGLETAECVETVEFVRKKNSVAWETAEARYISGLAVEFVSLAGNSLDLVYEMLKSAFDYLDNFSMEELEKFNDADFARLRAEEFASHWLIDRLRYLTTVNIPEIEDNIAMGMGLLDSLAVYYDLCVVVMIERIVSDIQAQSSQARIDVANETVCVTQ